MAVTKVATRRVQGTFQEQQAQLLAQQGASKTNQHVDTLRVLNNRKYIPLATDTGNVAAAAYADLLVADITTFLDNGFIIISFSASGIQVTNPGTAFFQLLVDGVVAKGMYTTVPTAGFSFNAAMLIRVAVKKGSHRVKVQWKTNVNSIHINAKTVVEEHAHLLVQEAL